ncbi:TIGR00282 family metallophosphoesterase [soil metagenome]
MGEAGIKTVENVLPALQKEHSIDLVIAQSENVSAGKGLSVSDYERLKKAGVAGFTGGNWTMHLPETTTLLEDENVAVTRPANYPEGTTGKRYKIMETKKGKVLIVSLLGSIVGKDAEKPIDNPLTCIDDILNMLSKEEFIAKVINFHGDFSSEKVVIGHYLDGRVTAVIGDHWHVPTADARVLPGGTAHITDVGMCGSLDSSLGVQFDSVVPRWRDGVQTRNILEMTGKMQFSAVIVDTDSATGRAASIVQIREIY